MRAEEPTVVRGGPGGPGGVTTPQASPIPVPTEEEASQGSIEQPAKLIRLAVMVRELLEEVRRAPLDENTRELLRDVHGKVVAELKTGLSTALAEELDRVSVPMSAEGVPSEAEIRIAQAQLLGWLEGLFQGIQAAIATQQLAAQAQLMEMRRRGLPPGATEDGDAQPGGLESRPGQYL